jgi:hypothetical protein
MFVCNICGESFHDDILCDIHKELVHKINLNDHEFELEDISLDESLPKSEDLKERNVEGRRSVIQYASTSKSHNVEDQEKVNNNSRASVIQYTSSKPLAVELLQQALPKSSVRHFKIKNFDFDLPQFLLQTKNLIVKTLKSELNRLNFIKFGLLLDCFFTNVQNEISPRGFLTKVKSLMKSSDIESIVDDCLQDITTKITEHEGRGSGWSLLKVDALNIRVHKHGYGDRGSSYIPLPKKIRDTGSCINIQNYDNECFRYAMLAKFITDGNVHRPNYRYEQLKNKYNFRGISYPVSLNDIKKFEKQNPAVSVNVFGLDERNNVYPLQITKEEKLDHTDLLLIKSDEISHYVYIKQFNTLVANQLSRRNVGITTCKRCFCYVPKTEPRGGRQWLLEHQRLCNEKEVAKIILPTRERAVLKFNKVVHQYRIPVVVYADFEASLMPIDIQNEQSTSRSKYQMHEPNSFCILVKSTLDEDHLQQHNLSSKPYIYRGEKAAEKFVTALYEIANNVEKLYDNIVPMKPLNEDQQKVHKSSLKCYLCNGSFTADNVKVHDHCHLTGNYRGPACNKCNINYKLPRFIPVILHNLSGYDAHFIVPQLGRDNGNIDVLATSTEKFISFSKKVGKIKLRFLDSFRFMPSSLMKLSENLKRADLKETRKLVPEENMDLVLQKGIFPYDYIDSLQRFEETSLPPAECFYSKLNEVELDPRDYQHACNVWNELNMRTLGEYNDFYIKLDVTLLCDIMEEFRNTCFDAYGLDPLHSYTSPGLAWQAMLKDTQCCLELLTDIDMLLMIESGVRGGLTQSVTRYVKANNKFLPDYDAEKESVFLGYFDANNLYGWAMSRPLPYGDFKWINPDTLGDIKDLPSAGNIGYILDCDFEYPDTLHDHHYDFPLLARSEIPLNGKHPKLLMTLSNKERYVAHISVVQQAIQMGLRITKVHRVIQFSQSCWLKPYIDSNTRRRALATSAFQKDFFKLMNNSVFGKTLENKRKHKNVKLVTDTAKLEKLVRQPNFQTSIIINENLVAVCMNKTKIKMDRPLYVGMSILDISKTHMYDFHYNKMVKFFGRENIGIAYMDTDAFIYWVKSNDLYYDIRTFEYNNEFDFSDYPKNHPNYDNDRNKKVLGKFKDEANGIVLDEIVALMAKLYALKLCIEDEPEEKSCIKKAKGIKNLYLKKNLKFEHYKKCLMDKEIYTAKFNTIRSFNHQLYSVTEVKKALSYFDDKRIILEDGIHTLPYGHYSLKNITDH